MSKTYEGEIVSDAQKKTTTSGKVVWWFAVKVKEEGMVDCQAWNCSCRGDFGRLSIGKPITINGYWKKTSYQDVMQRTTTGREDEFFVLNGFYFEDEPQNKADVRDYLIKEYGSLDEYRRRRKAYMEEQLKLGFVPVNNNGHTDFRPTDSCIKIGDKYVQKVDFCMDVLGVDYVSGELRNLFTGTDYKDLLNFSKNMSSVYKEKLNSLVERAQYQLSYESSIGRGN